MGGGGPNYEELINYNFSFHKISCMQNHFRCTPVHLGNHARRRADVHIANNNNMVVGIVLNEY